MDKKNLKNKQQDKKDSSQITKQMEEYKSQYLRALADYQNLEKRMHEAREKVLEESKEQIFRRLLPFLDNLDTAEVFIKDEGLKMIRDQFLQTLKNEGLVEIDVAGKPFDPYLCEAVEIVESDRDNIVLEVIKRGFGLGDRVLRPAQVRVGKRNPKH